MSMLICLANIFRDNIHLQNFFIRVNTYVKPYIFSWNVPIFLLTTLNKKHCSSPVLVYRWMLRNICRSAKKYIGTKIEIKNISFKM